MHRKAPQPPGKLWVHGAMDNQFPWRHSIARRSTRMPQPCPRSGGTPLITALCVLVTVSRAVRPQADMMSS